MRWFPGLVIGLSFVAFFAGSARAADLVQAKLLADISAIQPGKPFTLGVLLTIKPSWHVYWKNPGDSGLPTRVQFTLPEGFTAGELQFPTPVRIVDVGNIVSFGYRDEVLLNTTITPPPTLKTGGTISITAKSDWLCCETNCIPGGADLKIELPVSDSSSPANAELFKTWQPHFPTHDPETKVTGSLDASAKESSATITPHDGNEIECIVGAVDGLTITSQTSDQATVGGNLILIKAKKLKGQTVTATSVEVLLTCKNPNGDGRVAVTVDVPIVNADKPVKKE